MALLLSTLALELQALTPTMTPGESEGALARVYGDYMRNAMAGAVPIVGTAIEDIAVPAMAGAMAFSLGSAADGAAVVTSGVAAFWASMVAAPAVFFAGATAVTAPAFSGLTTALASTFSSNTSGSATLAQAAEVLAGDLHGATAGLGTATFPGPVVLPIS